MLDFFTSYWGGTVTFVSVLFAGYLKWFRFYTSTYIPRKLNLYDRLKESASDNSVIQHVIAMAADEEIFRIVFGQGGSPEYRKALIKLYETDKFSLRDLQLAKSCLDVDTIDLRLSSDEASIISKYGIFEKLSLMILSITLVVSVFFFSGLLLKFLELKSTPGYISAAVALMLFTISFFMIGSEIVRNLVSRRVCKKLDLLNEPSIQHPAKD